MARALWKGNLSFGLVQIPVTLNSAENSREMKFTMLDLRDHSPVGYERINKSTGKPVPWDKVVKGYEYEDGEYVVLSDEDFKRANVEATHSIDIVCFVDADEIDPIYFEKPYFVAPSGKNPKGYALLRETLERSEKVAVAKLVLRQREHLAAVLPKEEGLVLITLRYAYELRAMDELDLPSANLKQLRVTAKEIEMASMLVKGMTEKWEPEKFHDTYHDDLMALIEKKAKSGAGKEIDTTQPKAPRASNVVDIMALLKQSLHQNASSASAPKTRARRAPKAASTGSRRAKKKAAAGR